jgi:hypothetical protein
MQVRRHLQLAALIPSRTQLMMPEVRLRADKHGNFMPRFVY